MRITPCLLMIALLAALPGTAMAHFGMLIPSTNAIDQSTKSATLTLSFSHPFEMQGMDLVTPAQFFVSTDGEQEDLLPTLQAATVMGHKAWTADYAFPRPGVYQFAMEPQPYWEPAEDASIIHYTKTIIGAFGEEEGWETPLGLKTEIVPLTRPFGNFEGFSFSGRVLLDGNPVPGAVVEVEYYNESNKIKAPTPYHVTHVVHADDNGVFTFTCPQAGWWGFAALSESEDTLPDPSGTPKGVELGAVLWIKMDASQ